MKLYYPLLDLAREVAGIEGTATSGSTTSLVDTNQRSTADDFWNGGVLFFRSGTNNETTAIVTDYTNSSRTLNFATTGAVAANVAYTLTTPAYTRGDLVQAVNQALQNMGPLTQYNDTLTVTADTEEYTLPAGVANVVRVEVATADAEPWGWEANTSWREQGGKLIFLNGNYPTDASKVIRLWYNAVHGYVQLDADVVSDAVPRPRLRAEATYCAIKNRFKRLVNEDPSLKELLQMAQAEANEAKVRYPIRNMDKLPRLNVIG